ncbi:unnamed protein product [Arctogadus glacialis]
MAIPITTVEPDAPERRPCNAVGLFDGQTQRGLRGKAIHHSIMARLGAGMRGERLTGLSCLFGNVLLDEDLSRLGPTGARRRQCTKISLLLLALRPDYILFPNY